MILLIRFNEHLLSGYCNCIKKNQQKNENLLIFMWIFTSICVYLLKSYNIHHY